MYNGTRGPVHITVRGKLRVVDVTAPICQQCGGGMVKKTISTGNFTGIIFALIVFCIGVVLLIADDEAFNIIGILVILFSLFMGGKRRKVWKCKSCSSIVDRA